MTLFRLPGETGRSLAASDQEVTTLGAEARADIVRRYQRHESPSTIAKLYGWAGKGGPDRVRRILKAEGVVLFSGPEATRSFHEARKGGEERVGPRPEPADTEFLVTATRQASELQVAIAHLAVAMEQGVGPAEWGRVKARYYDSQCALDETIIQLDYVLDRWEARLAAAAV